MQFRIENSILHKAVKFLGKATAAKREAILECILIEGEAGGIRLTASDMNTTAIVHLPCKEVSEAEPVALQARTLLELLGTLPAGEILSVSKPKDVGYVEVGWNNGNARLPEMNGKDYPKVPISLDGDRTGKVEMSQAELLHLIDATGFATGNDDLHPFTGWIHFEFSESGRVTAVATDSRRLVASSENSAKTEGESSFNMNGSLVSLVKAYLTESTESVRLLFNAKRALLISGDVEIVSLLDTSQRFPAWEKVIPTSNGNILKAPKESLVKAMKRVMASLKDVGVATIAFTTSEETGLKIETKSLAFKTCSSETIPDATYTGSPLTIGFRADSLSEVIANIPAENVEMRLNTEKTAVLIIPEGSDPEMVSTKGIVMPMAINN